MSVAVCCSVQAQPPTPNPSDSGVTGTISLHGVSGGPVRKGVDDSMPLANTTFVVRQEDQVVATFTTDKQGRFRVALPPGRYTVQKKDWKSRVGFYGPFAVDVGAGQMKTVRWNCETGMQ